MQNTNPIITVPGKNMQISVYEDRAVLYKPNSQKFFVCRFANTTKVMFRPASHSSSGFLKMRGTDGMFDFVTFKFKRESQEHMQNFLAALTFAKDEINRRVVAARGLPEGSNVVQYF